MKKLPLQSLLMIMAILGITGFQLFWLKQTYNREERSLTIKSDLAFRDAIQELQVIKLKLDHLTGNDSLSKTKVKIMIGDSISEQVSMHVNGKKGVISTINVIRKKVSDTLLKGSSLNRRIIIAKDQTYFDRRLDMPVSATEDKPNRDQIFRLLYDVDSLQDSLKISEINTSLTKHLKQQNTEIPFTISRLDSAYEPDETNINEVTVGFVHPITYKLKLGNSFPYLVKQISLPILFSILLLGITILSFVLLYRNLMQQRRLTKIKNEFIGNITHELKTPIATVSVAIEAIKNFNALQDPGRTQEYLGIAGQELNRLSLLVDKVLRLSMLENREVELKIESFNVAEMLQEVLKSMQLQFEKCKAEVIVELTGVDFTIDADRMHITSVVYNLLDNAIKYRSENPVIKITAIADAAEIILKIADNGIGIDSEYKDKIFDKFFRVPHGDKHNIKGYGLGLSYAAHILDRHGGSIEAESEKKIGTEFIIKLPRRHGK